MLPVEDKSFSDRGYLAPTVFLLANNFLPRWNYYSNFNDALSKYKYLNKQTGGADVTPIGYVPFIQNGKAQTMGINVDFYALIGGKWLLTSYSYLKEHIGSLPPIIFRFYTIEGAGEYFAIYDKRYFGFSATAITNVSAAKLAELDAFYRETQLLKYRYNSLVSFLNVLASQELTPLKQQVFNEGMLLLTNLNNQTRNIDGIEIIFSKDGKIGLPVLLLIAVIAILAAATAWAATEINAETEKTKRINDSYELSKWVASKKTEISVMANNGQITASQAKDINDSLDVAQKTAVATATAANKERPNLLENAVTILKYGVIGYLAYLFIGKKKTASNG